MNASRARQQIELFLLALILLGIIAFQAAKYFDIGDPGATPSDILWPDAIHVLPGFKISLLHEAADGEGSWISMTADPQGRFIVSPQTKAPLRRLTIAHGKLVKMEIIPQPISGAMGLLYAKGSLFVDGQGPKGWGIYRMIDNGGVYGAPELVRPLNVMYDEHGSHAIVLGPDDKLYVVCGDHTLLPGDLAPSSPYRNVGDDQLLPRDEDSAGLGLGHPPEGGFILRMDLDGRNCELFAGGTRNIYSIAFNRDGELFGFDNDSEYNLGLPWYRPCKVIHWVSGGDYGHRQGTGEYPEYYEDVLPATLNVGLGAPSGVKFAPANCAFPAPYRNACFMEDWLNGRILAVDLIPRGASYQARVETLLQGRPLNVTAMEFGPDGALYFITGGHDIISGLYRLTYDGPKPMELAQTAGAAAEEKQAVTARQLRHELESYQGRREARAVQVAWPLLDSADRWLRYAARIALESQDPRQWRDRALAETNTYGGLTALLALARRDAPHGQTQLLTALERFRFADLDEEQALLKLRVLEVSFIRQGRPSKDVAAGIIRMLEPLYPSGNEAMNHELCQLLLYLDAPDAIRKTLELRDKAPLLADQIYYTMRLRTITNGWTPADRQDYFSWFAKSRTKAGRSPDVVGYFANLRQAYRDGQNMPLFESIFRDEAMATLSPAERRSLAAFFPQPKPVEIHPPKYQFVKAWTMGDLLPHLSRAGQPGRYSYGWEIFQAAQCGLCHGYGQYGRPFGPDLTTVGSRMPAREILESILEPSKVVAAPYQNTLLTLKNGDVVIGRVISDDAKNLLLITDPRYMTREIVPKAEIESRRLSKISPMPEGLLNCMTEQQIWDLVSFLEGEEKPAPPSVP